MTAPSIVEVHPANNAEGIVLSDQIYLVFDQEIDRTTVQVILEGPDTDRWSGPEQVRWDNPDLEGDDDILASPGYKGLITGSLSFEKIDTEGNGVSGYDYTGNGILWRTKVIFTSKEPLVPNTQYRVWIIGDEETEDSIISGTSSRTVFDTIKGANLGNGNVFFTGGYSGPNPEDIYTIRVKENGSVSDKLLFHFWRASAPMVVRELRMSQRSQILNDGVLVRFEGDFEIDDEFSVHVRTGERMPTTYTWIFTTGSGSIETIPSSVTQSPSVPVGSFATVQTGSSSSTFQIVSVSPVERKTNLDPNSIESITVEFSDNIDATTVTDESVEVWTEPVNGEFSNNDIQFSGELAKILTINGKILTIQIA